MFGSILKSLRESYELSQAKFAREIDFSQSAISGWENETREPGIEALVRISNYFNVSVDYLVGKPTTNQVIKKAVPTSLSIKAKELLEIFNSLEEEYQSQILEYARYFGARRGIKTKKA